MPDVPIKITGRGVAVFLGFFSLLITFIPGTGIGFWMRLVFFVLGLVLLFLGVRNTN